MSQSGQVACSIRIPTSHSTKLQTFHIEKKTAVKENSQHLYSDILEKNIQQFELCKPQNIFLCNCSVSQTLGILTGN